jgi:Ca2+-binding RTX toxin-like protein
LAHLFDFSRSLGPVNLLSQDLFTFQGGTNLSSQYWSPSGSLNQLVTYLTPSGQTSPSGEPILVQQSFRLHLDTAGVSLQTDPSVRTIDYRAGNPGIEAPSSYFTGSGNLTVATVFPGNPWGWFLRFTDVPTFAQSFLPGSGGVYADAGAAQAAVLAMIEFARVEYLGYMRSVQNMLLSEAGPIVMEYWAAGLEDRIKLTYTADPNTDMTVGTLFQLFQRLGEGSPLNPYMTEPRYNSDRAFAGEDVKINMTSGDDFFLTQTGGFAARTLAINGGGGGDVISVSNGRFGLPPVSDALMPQFLKINGGAGDDSIDVLVRQVADIWGGSGNDTISLGRSSNTGTREATVFAGLGDDAVSINGMAALLYGQGGNDGLFGGSGVDTLYGGAGDDDLRDGFIPISPTEVQYFRTANLFYGGDGNDSVIGGGVGDTIFGGEGNDWLQGIGGADTLAGNAGADRLDGGIGADQLTGGIGADRFMFQDTGHRDRITDFSRAEDVLAIDGSLASGRTAEQIIAQSATIVPNGVLIRLGLGAEILLEGLTSTAGLAATIEFI